MTTKLPGKDDSILDALEKAQEALKENIQESERLIADNQKLLKRHRASQKKKPT